MAELYDARRTPNGRLDIRAADVVDALTRRNPSASKEQVASTAQLMALIGEVVQNSDAGLPSGPSSWSEMRAFVELAMRHAEPSQEPKFDGSRASHSAQPNASPERLHLTPRGPVEILQGTGLGDCITLAEGRARLAAYATPLTLEEWAGPLAGSTELTRRLGIGRSTLQDWRRENAVIGLLRGKRKHVFPLAQFVDGRPVRGLSEVVAIIAEPRMAWLWLVEPDRHGGSYLDDLKRGRLEAVLEAAREDFA